VVAREPQEAEAGELERRPRVLGDELIDRAVAGRKRRAEAERRDEGEGVPTLLVPRLVEPVAAPHGLADRLRLRVAVLLPAAGRGQVDERAVPDGSPPVARTRTNASAMLTSTTGSVQAIRRAA
jgi:hypothetical protein